MFLGGTQSGSKTNGSLACSPLPVSIHSEMHSPPIPQSWIIPQLHPLPPIRPAGRPSPGLVVLHHY